MQPVFRGRYRLSGKTYLGGSAIVKIGVDEKTKAEVRPPLCTCSAYAYDLYTPCTRHARAMHTRCTRDAHVVAIELHARAVTLTPTRTLTRTLTRTQALTLTRTRTQTRTRTPTRTLTKASGKKGRGGGGLKKKTVAKVSYP